MFNQRPLHPDYRDYCIKDVLDLLYLREEMIKRYQLNSAFCDWVSSYYVKAGYDYIKNKCLD